MIFWSIRNTKIVTIIGSAKEINENMLSGSSEVVIREIEVTR